jgi:hypothetical protein
MFLIKATPRNSNGSMAFTIPTEIVKELDIKHGDQFQAYIKGRAVIFESIIK